MKENDIQEDINILNELLDDEIVPRLHRRYKNALEEIIEEVNKNTCTYEQIEEDYNVWHCSKCKCDWCIEEGTPIDNNMNYCPECGARIREIIELEEEVF
jgi:hypothetical protein